jgi:hypothetical protein
VIRAPPEAAREAVDLARAVGDPALQALALSAQAWETSWDGEHVTRVRLADEIGRIGSEQDLAAYRWCAEHIAATVAGARGDLLALRHHVAATAGALLEAADRTDERQDRPGRTRERWTVGVSGEHGSKSDRQNADGGHKVSPHSTLLLEVGAALPGGGGIIHGRL